MPSTSFGYGSKSNEIAQTGILVSELGLERDDIKNYITNGHFELDTLGWAASGAATLSRTTTTAELVRGVASLKMTTGASGDYVYYAFTIDPIDKSQSVYIQFNYLPLSGYASGDFTCVLHDGTTEIALSGVGTIPATGVLYVGTATLTASTTYQLRFKSGATSGRSVCIDRIMVGGMPNMATAANTASTPAGNLAATNVQTALNELQGDIDTITTGGSLTNATLAGTVTVSGGTASTWIYLNGTKQVTSFATATRALLTDATGNFTSLPYSSASAVSSIPSRDASGNTGFNKVTVAAGTLGGFDVTAAGDMYIGASVGLNKVYLGGTTSTYRLVGLTSTGIAHISVTGDVTSSLIVDADVASGAGIARSKNAAGTVAHVLINDGTTGLMSSEAQLAVTRGGTNITSYAVGDILYASAIGVLSKLPIGVAGQILQVSGAAIPSWVSSSGLGDVFGPASSTDNAIARFDATTGKLLQNSVVTIGDLGEVTGISTLNASGAVTFGSTLGVTGASTLAALSATTGSFSSTLSVTGASTFAAVSGTTGTFSSTFNATGAATFGSTLAVTGVATIGPAAQNVRHFGNGTFEFRPQTGTYLPTITTQPTITIGNAGGTASIGICSSDTSAGYVTGMASSDTGTSAALRLDGRLVSGAACVTRPIIQFCGNDIVYGSISATGAWTLGPAAGGVTHTLRGYLDSSAPTSGIKVQSARATPAAAADTQNVYSGTFTATIAATVNLDSISATATCQWMRVGNTVTVSGFIASIDTGAANTNTQFTMTLPVASDLGAVADLAGTAAMYNAASTLLHPWRIYGGSADNVAVFTTSVPVVLGVSDLQFHFTYRVI